MKRVFLIDDDEVFVFLTKKIVERSREEVQLSIFNNGQEAIDFLKDAMLTTELLPDVILLDLNMPVMDGWEFLDIYKTFDFTRQKPIRLYIVTSSISPHEVERAKSIQEVQEFIVKPIAKEKFEAIMAH